MTDTTASPAHDSRLGFRVRHEDLVLLVAVGDTVIETQLEPRQALELARDLLDAGLAHAQARAESRTLMAAVNPKTN